MWIRRFNRFWRENCWLILLLLVSLFLRWILILRGGSLFFPDESSNLQFWGVFRRLIESGPITALDSFLSIFSHTGFFFVISIPAVVQYTIVRLSGLPGDIPSMRETIWMPIMFLSIASMACIGLSYAIARRTGASKLEALLAALLIASSASMFYYSRHLLPYDSSMALALLALWIGLGSKSSPRELFAFSLAIGLSFMTYYGSWALVIIVMLISIWRARGSWQAMLVRGTAGLLGIIAFPTLMTIISILRGSTPFVLGMMRFSGTIKQGDPSEGWTMIWEYLWHAEHGLVLVWGIGLVALVSLSGRLTYLTKVRGWLWLMAAMLIYVLLVFTSNGLGVFVVYGRLARQLVPFLCLMAATGIYQGFKLYNHRSRVLGLAITLLIVIQAMFNFIQPMSQQWPRDIAQKATLAFGQIQRDVSILGPRHSNSFSRYVILNIDYLYPVVGKKDPPIGCILFTVPHPFEYLPYQYEGFDAKARKILRITNISVRLIDTQYCVQEQ